MVKNQNFIIQSVLLNSTRQPKKTPRKATALLISCISFFHMLRTHRLCIPAGVPASSGTARAAGLYCSRAAHRLQNPAKGGPGYSGGNITQPQPLQTSGFPEAQKKQKFMGQLRIPSHQSPLLVFKAEIAT